MSDNKHVDLTFNIARKVIFQDLIRRYIIYFSISCFILILIVYFYELCCD